MDHTSQVWNPESTLLRGGCSTFQGQNQETSHVCIWFRDIKGFFVLQSHTKVQLLGQAYTLSFTLCSQSNFVQIKVFEEVSLFYQVIIPIPIIGPLVLPLKVYQDSSYDFLKDGCMPFWTTQFQVHHFTKEEAPYRSIPSSLLIHLIFLIQGFTFLTFFSYSRFYICLGFQDHTEGAPCLGLLVQDIPQNTSFNNSRNVNNFWYTNTRLSFIR